MIKIKGKVIFGALLFIGLLSCEKETDNDPLLDIYGKWALYGVSGGVNGGSHELTFDFLEIESDGIYSFIRDDNVIEFGRIKINEQTNETLLITFEPDANSETFMYDPVKYVNLSGKNTLSLDSPCCDRFNYHFNRN
jgi:hypothetical protein